MSASPFTHYLITRFNLKKADWNKTKSGNKVLTEEWLEKRFQLFEQYTFPSLQNQTNQRFTWLVFFDTETPLAFKNRIDHLQKKMANFQPVFVEDMTQFYPGIIQEVAKCTTPYTITSRIDNDDCLSNRYMETVQSYFNRQSQLILDFPDGYSLEIKPHVRLGKKRWIFNPFISLIEKNEHPQTVWKKTEHHDWKEEKNIKLVNGERVWMNIIHAGNKVNEFKGFGKTTLSQVLPEFGFQASRIKSLETKTLPFNQWRLKSFRHRMGSYWRASLKKWKNKMGLYSK